jgi:hypothetical protein
VDATPIHEQLFAVWELLDDLRERIWTLYCLVIQNQLREQQETDVALDDYDYDQDLPF